MNILAFGASSSKQSINQQFAHWAAHQFDGEVNLIDLNDFEMPLYSIDRETEDGIPDEAHDFIAVIEQADFLVVSMAEHNGSFTAAFKNVLDWSSRAHADVFQDKPMLLLSTSPGGLGAKFSGEQALSRFPRHKANVLAYFSLPEFQKNFDNGITNETLNSEFEDILTAIKENL